MSVLNCCEVTHKNHNLRLSFLFLCNEIVLKKIILSLNIFMEKGRRLFIIFTLAYDFKNKFFLPQKKKRKFKGHKIKLKSFS